MPRNREAERFKPLPEFTVLESEIKPTQSWLQSPSSSDYEVQTKAAHPSATLLHGPLALYHAWHPLCLGVTLLAFLVSDSGTLLGHTARNRPLVPHTVSGYTNPHVAIAVATRMFTRKQRWRPSFLL